MVTRAGSTAGLRGLAIILVALGVSAALVLAFAGGAGAKTGPAAARGGGGATDDPVLAQLQADDPNLQLDSAQQVLADDAGTLWLTPAADGGECVVERVADPASLVTSRYSCASAADAAARGVIGGVPGAFYGVAPAGVMSVIATVDDVPVGLTLTDQAYRVPAEATAVTVGGSAPIALPAPLAG